MQRVAATTPWPRRPFSRGCSTNTGKPVVAALLLDVERQMASTKGRRLISDDVMVTCIEVTSASAGGAGGVYLATGQTLRREPSKAPAAKPHPVGR